jgi:hypothetical protein
VSRDASAREPKEDAVENSSSKHINLLNTFNKQKEELLLYIS